MGSERREVGIMIERGAIVLSGYVAFIENPYGFCGYIIQVHELLKHRIFEWARCNKVNKGDAYEIYPAEVPVSELYSLRKLRDVCVHNSCDFEKFCKLLSRVNISTVCSISAQLGAELAPDTVVCARQRASTYFESMSKIFPA